MRKISWVLCIGVRSRHLVRNAGYVYWDGTNTDGDLTDWSKNRSTATITAGWYF